MWKGRKLVAPAGEVARPTADRVKEALFSILGSCRDDIVLDLFAGSGALGIEALSRGAAHVVFADVSNLAIAAVATNLQGGAGSQSTLWKLDWKRTLASISSVSEGVDWVFVDPPYAQNLWIPVLTTLSASAYPVHRGIVCEHPKTICLPERIGRFHTYKFKIYGSVALSFYEARDELR